MEAMPPFCSHYTTKSRGVQGDEANHGEGNKNDASLRDMMFFAALKMMLLHCVSQWCDVCHKMWRSHASLGIAIIIGRSPTSFAEGKHHWKKPSAYANGFFLGRGRRIRTRDPRFWRPVLYQLSYTPVVVISTTAILYHNKSENARGFWNFFWILFWNY